MALTVADLDRLVRRGPTASAGVASGTGTSAAILPANVNRKFLLVQNLGVAPLFVNFGAPAVGDSTSIRLSAVDTVNSILRFDGGFIPTESVNILNTATQSFVVKEG